MSSSRIIQNIFKAYANKLENIPQIPKNKKALFSLMNCRTSEMGSTTYRCPEGHQSKEEFHSCRHRICSLCSHGKRKEWVDAQKQRIFNMPHFHVVFTIPEEYRIVWQFNESLFTALLFRSSKETLLELTQDKKYQGVTPGILITLHTWGRQLQLHPHTHCVISAGGLDSQNEWKEMSTYLFPSRVASVLHRGKIQSFLAEAAKSGELKLPPDLPLSEFWKLHSSLYKKSWNVRVEEQYQSGKGVVLYLARYCKGGPLNPRQIKRCSDKEILMSFKDHREGRTKIMRLQPEQFLRRVLLHVPAKGVHTVRYYGLYAPSAKKKYEKCLEYKQTIEARVSYTEEVDELIRHACGVCGESLQMQNQRGPERQKAFSIYKERDTSLARGSGSRSVQQCR